MFDDAYNSDRDQQLTALLNAGQLEQAMELLETWHAGEPWNGDVLMRMAVVHWLAGEPARTLRDLDAYLAMDPDNAEALSRRAQALLMLGKVQDAEASLAKAEAIDPTTPGVLLNRALIQESHEDYAAAVQSLTEYLEQVPTDHLALARRSHLHRQLGLFQQALSDARRCVEMHPEDPEAHFAEALALVTLERGEEALDACDRCLLAKADFLPVLRLKIDLLADTDRLPEAERHLDALLATDPDSPQTMLLRARVATEEEDFQAALDWMNRYLDDAPDEAHGYYRRGMVYMRMGNMQRALEDFQQYSDLNPSGIEGYEQQFMCYLELGDIANALGVGTIAVTLQPDNYRLQYNLGFAKLLDGKLGEATRGFMLALRLDPSNEELALRIFLALTEHASPLDRLTIMRELAQEMGTASPILQGLLAECYLEYDQPREALALIKTIIEASPHRPFGYLLGMKAHSVLGFYDEALAIAEDGVAHLPDDGQLRLARAVVLRDASQPEAALQELDIAESLLPGDPEIVRQRALVYGSVGDVVEAVELLQKAIQLDASSVDSFFWLGYFNIHRKRYREALAAADHLLTMIPGAPEGQMLRSAALRGLKEHDAANAALAQVQRDDPELLVRLGADPVMAKLLEPVDEPRVVHLLRRFIPGTHKKAA